MLLIFQRTSDRIKPMAFAFRQLRAAIRTACPFPMFPFSVAVSAEPWTTMREVLHLQPLIAVFRAAAERAPHSDGPRLAFQTVRAARSVHVGRASVAYNWTAVGMRRVGMAVPVLENDRERPAGAVFISPHAPEISDDAVA